jgi:organic radical activating enzyme
MSEENTNIDKKSTFCILPYIHEQTKPNGQIKPCCRFDHKHSDYQLVDGTFKFDKFNINTSTSFTSAIMSEEWQEIRDTMKRGERVPGCRKCYQEEDFAYNDVYKNQKKRIKSMRGKENWLWNKDNQETVNENNQLGKLRYLELALGTYCNLKCRTCTADLSSAWVEDETILSKKYLDRRIYTHAPTIESNWDIKDFENVEEIKFTGGEPMLHPNFIKIIDLILSTNRAHLITLDIYTNASWIPRDKVLSRLKQFKNANINLSIDGLGKVNDYVRAPSEWSVVEDSVKQWLTAENDYPKIFSIKWAPCVSVYNVWQFDQMIAWWFDLQKSIKNKNWWESITHTQTNGDIEVSQLTTIVNIVHDPKYLSAALYPDKIELTDKLIASKREYVAQIKDAIASEKDRWAVELHIEGMYNKVIGILRSPLDQEQLKTFIEYTVDLDRLRNEDLRTAIPEVWKQIKDKAEYKGRL